MSQDLRNGARAPTIRARLTALVMASVLPGFVMLSLWAYYDYGREKERLVSNSLGIARAMVALADQEITASYAALTALGTSTELDREQWEEFYDKAKAVERALGLLNVLVFDAETRQILNTALPQKSPLPDGRFSIVERAYQSRSAVVSDLFRGPVIGDWLIGVVVPAQNGRHALGASFSPTRLSRLLQQPQLPPEWIAAIFDSSGAIVARSRSIAEYLGKPGSPALVARMREDFEGSLETTTLEGVSVVSAFSRSKVTGWSFAIGIPAREIRSALWRRLAVLAAGAMLVLLTSFGLASALGHSIAASVRSLVPVAQTLGSGREVEAPAANLREAQEVGAALVQASEILAMARHGASHDALTGLPNRALFNEELDRQLALAARQRWAVGVMYIDLDSFKQINDRHGHSIGDEVLKEAAARLKRSVRGSDLVARLAGDEFAAILVDADAASARVVAAKILEMFSRPLEIGGLRLSFSASIGIALYPQDSTNKQELIDLADKALYRAKASGRRTSAYA